MEKKHAIMIGTKRIILTGPESTGKSVLTRKLGEFFGMPVIPEIARSYIQNLGRPYNKLDVLEIAKIQVETEREILRQKPEMLFVDTDLIVTKIWLLHVYKYCPVWIDVELNDNRPFLHLLCYYDLPWVYDPLRENPDIREYLFDLYRKEIEILGLNYNIVRGLGDERFSNALNFIESSIANK